MKKHSNKKWLYIGTVSIFALTLAGIFFTVSSYRATKNHALEMGQAQLAIINDSAIKNLTLKLESYAFLLETLANSLPADPATTADLEAPKLTEDLVIAIDSCYLLSTTGDILASWFSQDSAGEQPLLPPDYLKLDPFYQEALQGTIADNGAAYFWEDQAYFNLYKPTLLANQEMALFVLTLDLAKLYQTIQIDSINQFNGYTMIKNQEMKVLMHPSAEQIGLSIVEDRQKTFPEFDYSDLKKLEQEQLTHEEGTLDYHSYWWTNPNPQKVLKLSAYRWITIGQTRWIVASLSDFDQVNNLNFQEAFITIGLLLILLTIIILVVLNIYNYFTNNQTYLENVRLKERQTFLKEKHQLEKKLIQESKLETIGLLTTSIVHDMNNFLTPILGNLQLLLEEYQDNQLLVSDLQEIYQAAEKGQQLSTNVLRFSTNGNESKELLEVGAVVKEALATMKILIPNSVTLLTDYQTQGKSYFVKDDLQVILYNLLTNAYQARPQGAVIQVTLRLADPALQTKLQEETLIYHNTDFLMIDIQDNGYGIPKEVETEIFTPFFTTKKATGGTGLGLFIVASIIKKNDWFLDVNSTSEGTCFQIGLPIIKAEE